MVGKQRPGGRRRAYAAAMGLLAGVVTVWDRPAEAATIIVAAFEMNDPAGTTTLVDSGPYGLHGTIGSEIVVGATYKGATGLRWLHTPPNAPPAKPERIANVPSSPRLNPDAAEYAVEFRYRTTKNFGNIVQKGQNGTRGGYFKFEQPSGFMTCMFKGGNGEQRAVKSPVATNDGEWHTIRCERSSWGIKLFVDGVRVKQLKGPTGTISNNKPLSIGGKSACDQIKITCDYFTGDIDYVRIEKSGA